MRYLIIVALIGYIKALALDRGIALDRSIALDAEAIRDADRPLPPQPNPHTNNDFDVPVRSASDEIGQTKRIALDNGASDSQCNLNAIISATGESLVNLVKSAPDDCVNGIFGLIGNDAKNACNEADMTSVANAFYGTAYYYDSSKPASSPGILNMAQYLRGCYYAQGNNEKDVPKYSSTLQNLIKQGIDGFLKRPLEAKNDAHYQIAYEVISLISNAHETLNYASQLSLLLDKLSNVYTFAWSPFIQKSSQGDVINAIFDIFFRSHYDEKAAIPYYKQHPEVAKYLFDFTLKQAGLLNQKGEWILRNAAGELGRFLKYDFSYSLVSGYIKTLLSKYTPSNAIKVWAAIASKVEYYDKKNCAAYNLCNMKADMEKKILPITKVCPTTYTDTFKVRAQDISASEAETVCQRLKAQESHYHNLVNSGWKPVNPDTNKMIEVVIFNNTDEYKTWANMLFGINTDNGGMYMEGDPSKEGNIARYFCYERPKDGQFNVWNLEHEFTHYLDGRYDMLGDFGASSKGKTIWWIEGFAEYAANKNQYPSMVDDCKAKKYSLSTIFKNDYSSGTDRIYHYGYLAARFMFEKHRNDVNTIMGYFRVGKYADYETFMKGIGSRYDQEFSQWCGVLAG